MREPHGHDEPAEFTNTSKPIEPAELKKRRELNWSEYRQFADQKAIGVRKVGLLDEGLALQAIQDERTITIQTGFGDMPILTPIEYASGFDIHRATEIARNHTTTEVEVLYYFCLPPNFLDEATQAQKVADMVRRLNGQKIGIYFDFVENDPQSRELLLALLNRAGIEFNEITLHDGQTEHGERDVSINFYRCVTSHSETKPAELPDIDIYEAYRIACEKGEFEYLPKNGAGILKGSELQPDLVEKLWDIYQNRFAWLGENHPISMEDEKDQFIEALKDENTALSVFFKDGEPVCWTYFTTNTDAEYWLNKSFIQKHIEPGTELLFFPGIVAKKIDDMAGFSKPTLRLAALMVGRTSRDYTVMFENTGVSEEYIPRLVKEYADSSNSITVNLPTKVDNTLYGLVVAK